MKAVVSLDDFRKNLSDIVGRVMYGNETVVVQKHNRTGVIVMSEREYEQLKDPLKRFATQEEWDKLFLTIDKIRERTKGVDEKEIEKLIDEEVQAVRAQKRNQPT